MPPIARSYAALRLAVQTHVGRSPLLYRGMHRLRGAARSANLVDAASDVCIEAPSGSGNSFFVNGFMMINPGARVAHHHHVAAQLKRSAALGIPSLAILRNPIDCVASRSQDAPWLTGPVFDQWLRFFQAADALQGSLLLLTFETVTGDPCGAVQRLNERFGCDFESVFPEPSRVFAHMDAAFGEASPGDTRNPNRPDPARAEARARARRIAQAHRLAAPALALHDRLRRVAG
jgi:hypothetical protein